MNAGVCQLCDGAAIVGPVPAADGKGYRAMTLTECPSCRPWTISKMYEPLLAKENADTKRRISAKVREQFESDPDNPLAVTEALMHFCRSER